MNKFLVNGLLKAIDTQKNTITTTLTSDPVDKRTWDLTLSIPKEIAKEIKEKENPSEYTIVSIVGSMLPNGKGGIGLISQEIRIDKLSKTISEQPMFVVDSNLIN